MALVTATYLINDNTGEEKFVINLPSDYPYGPHERLVERQITEEDYQVLAENKGNHLKIFRYVDDVQSYKSLVIPPKGLNYKVGLSRRLHHKPSFHPSGLLTGMEFYANAEFNPATISVDHEDLILKTDFNYTIDPSTRFVIRRDKVVTWYTEDGTPCSDIKIMTKWYSMMEMDAEIIQRRTNFISVLKLEVAQFLAWLFSVTYPDPNTRPSSNDASKEMIKQLNLPILNYINGGDKAIGDIIQGIDNDVFEVTMPQHGISLREYLVTKIRDHG